MQDSPDRPRIMLLREPVDAVAGWHKTPDLRSYVRSNLLPFLLAFGTHAMRRGNREAFMKVIFEAGPLIVVANLLAPGADAQEIVQKVEPRQQPAREKENHSPHQQQNARFHYSFVQI